MLAWVAQGKAATCYKAKHQKQTATKLLPACHLACTAICSIVGLCVVELLYSISTLDCIVDHTACIGYDVESSHQHAPRQPGLPEWNTLCTKSGLIGTCVVNSHRGRT